MSLLAATQIPKPTDEQAFERASLVLWRGLLCDPNVQRNGRRGQGQNGVDLFGVRNGDPAHVVGIQCKLKGDGRELTAKEVRHEVSESLNFRPELREFFIITTAPDNADLQELARELSVEQKVKGRSILFYIWGWNTLQERITEDAAARKAFDPDYGPFSEQLLDRIDHVAVIQAEIRASIGSGFSQLDAKLASLEVRVSPGDATTGTNALEAHIDADIDSFRDLSNSGKPRTALPLLEGLLVRVEASASGRILFRIKANIGYCLLALGEEVKAAQLLSDAFDHAPTEPKAIANKAFSLLLQGRWEEVLSWGRHALAADPTNDGLAGYLVQSTRFDASIHNPLDLVPDVLKDSAPVFIGQINVLRQREQTPDWWLAAQAALTAHPEDPLIGQFAAEAELDEILRNESFRRTHMLGREQRKRLIAATGSLRNQWNRTRTGDGGLKPQDVALCCSLIIAYHALDDFPVAIELARQGLALAPGNTEIASRAAIVAIDGGEDALAKQVLEELPEGSDATVLRFRFHAARGDWGALAKLHKTQSKHIPSQEQSVIHTAGKLAEIRLARPTDLEKQIEAIADDVGQDARASVVVADFARIEGFDRVSENAYQTALKLINPSSHFADRITVAQHAARRGAAGVVADLLDGHVPEDHNNDGLSMLVCAFVNDTPIRRRAVRLFERLPAQVKDLPFYLHAEGLLHFNRGALKQAENCLRKAIAASPDLTNHLALFLTLRRSDRRAEIKAILENLDLAALRGTPGQKMYLAQELLVAGLSEAAFSFAYGVLQEFRNDPEAALRYFGLMMLDPNGRNVPHSSVVGLDAWVRLEGEHGETQSFLIVDGLDRPADGHLTVKHPLVAAALRLKVGNEFTIEAAFGTGAKWRVAEVKHKYLHALHDVMANFQTRFPDAKGLYAVRMEQGNIQPLLRHVRQVSETNRKLADLYLNQHIPMTMVASRLGHDGVGFANYLRSLNHNIETCVGNDLERRAARDIILKHRSAGAVLDAYTAWTAATMDALDVLVSVFARLVIPRSCIDELRGLRAQDDVAGERSMAIAWHNGQYLREEVTREETETLDRYVAEQIEKIKSACEIVPSAAADAPSELAKTLTANFGSDVLDPVHISTEGFVLVSEDLYYRQMAAPALGAEVQSVWLQAAFTFARDAGLIDHERHAALTVKLAKRRHSHVWLEPETLWHVWRADNSAGFADFRAICEFIGTQNADIVSHINVVSAFLERARDHFGLFDTRAERATGILLEHLLRFRTADWPNILALVAEGSLSAIRSYIYQWMIGHFLNPTRLYEAEAEVTRLRSRVHMASVSMPQRPALWSTDWPMRGPNR